MATKFNAAFWKWFGDSKVTNSNGNPLTVYHGSRNIIEEFDIGMCEFGCHFGTKAQAEFIMTRGDHLYECYLSIQNPIRLKDCGGWTWECLWKQLEGHGFDIPAMKPAEEARGYAVIRRQIAEHGYDGIVYLNRHEAISHDDIDKVMDLWMRGKADKNWARESSDTEFRKVVKSAKDSWIVLNPAQIKSIDNDGTWDSDDPDIRSNPKNEKLPSGIRKIVQGKIYDEQFGAEVIFDFPAMADLALPSKNEAHIYYLESTTPGYGRKAVKVLRDNFKTLIVVNSIPEAEGFWGKMLHEKLVDEIIEEELPENAYEGSIFTPFGYE